MTDRVRETTRIVCISDTHSHYDFIIPDGDILVHAGDFSVSGVQNEVEEFIDWLKSLDRFRLKIFIAGNHERTLDPHSYRRQWKRWHRGRKQNHQLIQALVRNPSLATDYGIIYLQEEEFVDPTTGLKFFGSPYEPSHHRGTFYLPIDSDEMADAWSRIPHDVDILITHCPPRNILDQILSGRHVGCSKLLERLDVIKPRLHVFGHIHEAYGQIKNDSTIFVNAAICNRKYHPIQAPFVIDLETKNWS